MFHFQLYNLHFWTVIHNLQVDLKYSVLPPRKNESLYNLAKNLVIYGDTLNITKRLDINLATFVTIWQRKNTYPSSTRHAEEKVIQGTACGLPACTQNDWTTIMADFVLLNFMYKSRFQIKHFNVKTTVHLNNWTWFVFCFCLGFGFVFTSTVPFKFFLTSLHDIFKIYQRYI